MTDNGTGRQLGTRCGMQGTAERTRCRRLHGSEHLCGVDGAWDKPFAVAIVAVTVVVGDACDTSHNFVSNCAIVVQKRRDA